MAEEYDLEKLLARLQAADLIRLVQTHPDLEYWFKHAVIQETVYNSLLKSTRAELHLRIAEAIERLEPDDAPDKPAMLALHYERAGQDRQAFKYAVQAGDRARRAYALREAVGFYDRALAMAERLGEAEMAREVLAVHEGRGRALEMLGDHDQALASFQAMLRVAQALGDPAPQAEALTRVTTIQILADGLTPAAEQQLNQALDLALEAKDPLLVGRTLWNLGFAYRFEDPLRGITYLRRALSVAESGAGEDERMRELAGYIHNDLSIALFVSGHFHEGAEVMRRGVEIFRALDHRSMLTDVLGGMGIMSYNSGDPAGAREAASEGLALSKAVDSPWGFVYNTWSLGRVEIDAGHFEMALAIATRALSVARGISFPIFVGMIQTISAQVYLELGMVKEAQAADEEAARYLRMMRAPNWCTEAAESSARAAFVRGDMAEAWAILEPLTVDGPEREKDMEAVAETAPLVAQVGLASGYLEEVERFLGWLLPRLEGEYTLRLVGEMLFWRGRLRLAQGDPARAAPDLERARELLARSETKILLWRVDATLAEVHAALGEAERAAASRQSAVEIVSDLASGIIDEALRRSFLSRPEVAALVGQSARG